MQRLHPRQDKKPRFAAGLFYKTNPNISETVRSPLS